MKLQSIKFTLAAIWITAGAVAGFALPPDSTAGLAGLAGMMFLPPLIMMWKWQDPPQTLSQRIQRARR